jgi:hypothetical protein
MNPLCLCAFVAEFSCVFGLWIEEYYLLYYSIHSWQTAYPAKPINSILFIKNLTHVASTGSHITLPAPGFRCLQAVTLVLSFAKFNLYIQSIIAIQEIQK